MSGPHRWTVLTFLILLAPPLAAQPASGLLRPIATSRSDIYVGRFSDVDLSVGIEVRSPQALGLTISVNPITYFRLGDDPLPLSANVWPLAIVSVVRYLVPAQTSPAIAGLNIGGMIGTYWLFDSPERAGNRLRTAFGPVVGMKLRIGRWVTIGARFGAALAIDVPVQAMAEGWPEVPAIRFSLVQPVHVTVGIALGDTPDT